MTNVFAGTQMNHWLKTAEAKINNFVNFIVGQLWSDPLADV